MRREELSCGISELTVPSQKRPLDHREVHAGDIRSEYMMGVVHTHANRAVRVCLRIPKGVGMSESNCGETHDREGQENCVQLMGPTPTH